MDGYEIYSSVSATGPFTSVGTTSDPNITTFTHSGANANTQAVYYYLTSLSKCGNIDTESAPSDTVASIYLDVVNSGGGNATLNWNPVHNPLLSTSSTNYNIYRKFSAGSWILLTSTTSTTYVDLIGNCSDDVEYRIEIDDNLPCTSTSNENGTTITGNADFSVINVCLGEDASFSPTNTGAGTSWDWDFGDAGNSTNQSTTHTYLAPGIYDVSLSVDGGMACTKQIEVYPKPILTTSPDQTICLWDNLPLFASGADKYEWSPPGIFDNAFISSPTATPNTTTAVQVIGATLTNCTALANININVLMLPVNTFDYEPFPCQGTTVTIISSVDPGMTYSWSTGETGPSLDISADGTYILTRDDGQCFEEDTATITYVSPQEVELPTDTVYCLEYLTLELGDPNAVGYNYWWSTGETTQAITVFSPEIIDYEMTSSCETTVGSISVEYDCLYYLYIPNAFTPNEDELNPSFKIKGDGIVAFEMIVFNRWGEQVFNTMDVFEGWDGGDYPSGIYAYKVTLIDVIGVNHSYSGSINLIR